MKRALKIVAVIVAALLVVAIAIPFFIDVNRFRPELESKATAALGRQVRVGNLSLSLLRGAVTADDISIADDPTFSQSPFVRARSLKVGVEIFPLIFSKALHVTEITLNQPAIDLVRSESGETWNFSSLGNKGANANAGNQPQPAPTSPPPGVAQPAEGSTPDLSVAKLNINNGSLTVARAGSSAQPRVYDKVDIEVDKFSFLSAFPFKMSAALPAGGSLKLDGQAGPIDASNAAQTPLQAKVTVKDMNLSASGFIDPASGISGIADFDGTVTSDGHDAKTQGTLKAAKLQVSQKGSPAGRTVEVTYSVTHDLLKQTGSISEGDVDLGKAVAHLTGTYNAHGAVTEIDMKLNGSGMPVDDLEAMLPALGVTLPPKSKLKGGTLNIDLTISGPVNKLVTAGNIRMENSALAGFNLGSKLHDIPGLGGKGESEKDTVIQNFSSDVHVAPDGTRAENINLTVPSIGVVTGGGTVSPANDLAFKMNASLGGLNIPFSVSGTTSDPKFSPDMKGVAKGLLKDIGNGQKNPVGGITGLFKKKQNP